MSVAYSLVFTAQEDCPPAHSSIQLLTCACSVAVDVVVGSFEKGGLVGGGVHGVGRGSDVSVSCLCKPITGVSDSIGQHRSAL